MGTLERDAHGETHSRLKPAASGRAEKATVTFTPSSQAPLRFHPPGPKWYKTKAALQPTNT